MRRWVLMQTGHHQSHTPVGAHRRVRLVLPGTKPQELGPCGQVLRGLMLPGTVPAGTKVPLVSSIPGHSTAGHTEGGTVDYDLFISSGGHTLELGQDPRAPPLTGVGEAL